jgi:hypothetical protein
MPAEVARSQNDESLLKKGRRGRQNSNGSERSSVNGQAGRRVHRVGSGVVDKTPNAVRPMQRALGW